MTQEEMAEFRAANPDLSAWNIQSRLKKWEGGQKFENRAADAIYGSQRAMADAGVAVIPELEAGTSATGMDSGIGSILANSSALTGAGTSGAANYLQSVGLGGRGAAAAEAGRVTDADAFAIEDELNRRRQGLAGIGMTGVGLQSDAMNAMGARGQTQALYQAQRKAQQRTQEMNMLGGLIGAFGGANFGGRTTPGASASDYTGSQMANWVARQ